MAELRFDLGDVVEAKVDGGVYKKGMIIAKNQGADVYSIGILENKELYDAPEDKDIYVRALRPNNDFSEQEANNLQYFEERIDVGEDEDEDDV